MKKSYAISRPWFEFGRTVYALRKDNDLTPKEFGDLFDVTSSHISHIEVGRNGVSDKLAQKMEETLGLEEGSLIGLARECRGLAMQDAESVREFRTVDDLLAYRNPNHEGIPSGMTIRVSRLFSHLMRYNITAPPELLEEALVSERALSLGSDLVAVKSFLQREYYEHIIFFMLDRLGSEWWYHPLRSFDEGTLTTSKPLIYLVHNDQAIPVYLNSNSSAIIIDGLAFSNLDLLVQHIKKLSASGHQGFSSLNRLLQGELQRQAGINVRKGCIKTKKPY